MGAYDEETQIHAGWLLWRADKLLKPRKQAIMHAYKQLGFDLAKGIAESRGGRRAPFPRKRKRAKPAKRNRDGTFTPGGGGSTRRGGGGDCLGCRGVRVAGII